MTIDQLTYVLERKYINILINTDVSIALDTSHTFGPNGEVQQYESDAYIIEWRLDLEQPTTEQLNQWWNLLKDQYNADPYRPDSEMAAFLKTRAFDYELPIIVNPEF
ncbi:MAG: hypothetical protein CTY12_00215 [Methylotenera sp.]|nr:MAG: hypothetical protein CTY12_00215 [Methylotenera sp.]